MKWETMNYQRSSWTGSFQQKSTGLSLVITVSVTLYYVVNMWPMRPNVFASESLPGGYGGLVLSTLVLLIGAQIVLQAILAISVGSDAAATAQERLAALKATRHAYWVLSAGMMATIGSVFLPSLSHFYTANMAIISLALAEIVKDASQLFYARH